MWVRRRRRLMPASTTRPIFPPLSSLSILSLLPYTRRCIYALILLFGGKNCRRGFSFRIIVSPRILNTRYTRRHSKKMGCPVDREKPVRIVVANCRRKLREEIWRNRGIRLFWKEFIYLERNCKEIAENLLKIELLSSSLWQIWVWLWVSLSFDAEDNGDSLKLDIDQFIYKL